MSVPTKLVTNDFVSGLIAKHVRDKMMDTILTRLRETLDVEISKMVPEVKQIVQDFVGKVVVEKVYDTHEGVPVINVLVKEADKR